VNPQIEILEPGPLTTIQDLGRPGYGHWGVSHSGAADRSALRLGNRLLENPASAAGLEVTAGGLRLKAHGDVTIALTGALCPAMAGDRAVAHRSVIQLADGHVLRLGPTSAGVRAYIAVRGGLALAPVLGSLATDLLSGLGPPVVAKGDRLPVGPAPRPFPTIDCAPGANPPTGDVTLRIFFGPRDDWFEPAARDVLLSHPWSVTSQSSRVGVRLSGPQLPRRIGDELSSEGLVRGALQVPPGGRPTLFLADHPVTGGYPVVAVVLDADIDLAAQVTPGQRLRFRDVGPERRKAAT
jgi:biotin-dependent carboxylase-like uncharacterized protein